MEIIVRTKDDEQEKLVIPAEYKIAKRKNYRFYSKNGCFIAVEEMILPLCVIDVSAKVADNWDYVTTLEDIQEWE